MNAQNPQPSKTIWQVSRRFDGTRNPEALLRALIQAHKR